MTIEDVNPEMLRWARETAGLTLEQSAGKLGLTNTAKGTAAETLESVEAGLRRVGGSFLKKAAALYSRPLLVFYLASPPPVGERGADYRTTAARFVAGIRMEALLDALVRDVRARQQMLREVRVEVDGADILPFIGSVKSPIDAAGLAQNIRETLGLTVEDQLKAKNADALFRILRNACGAVGIYVMLLGDLGTHHSDLGEDVFRGLAVSDSVAPLVVVNDNDAVTARSFTLIHELAHLWMGASGVSGPLDAVPAASVERFCNEVASEFLLPARSMSDIGGMAGQEAKSAVAEADRIGEVWNVSPAAVIYRAAMAEIVQADTARAAFAILASRWRTMRQQERAGREKGEGGPTYYVTRRFNLGPALLDVVRRALQDDAVTHVKAARILGVAPTSVEALLRERPRAT